MKSNIYEPEVITRKGKPVSVILPIDKYRELLERAEDAEDAAYLRRLYSKRVSFRSLDAYLADHKRK